MNCFKLNKIDFPNFYFLKADKYIFPIFEKHHKLFYNLIQAKKLLLVNLGLTT